jgi:ferritin
MLNAKIQEALNEQFKEEMFSAYVYLSMSAYFEANDMPGFANWMRFQSQEEVKHAMKFFDFINERGGKVELQAIAQPPIEFGSPEAVFAKALEHEQHISGCIHRIYQLALDEKDYPTQVMLHWFIEEQVEEEQSVGQILEMVRKAENRPWALLILDNQVGKRADSD